jgi:membrane protein implicated in regulation of membrane protease activity
MIVPIYFQFLILLAISFIYIILIFYIRNLLYDKKKLQSSQKAAFESYKGMIKNLNNKEYLAAKQKELLKHSKEIIFTQLLFLFLIPIYLIFYYLIIPFIFAFVSNAINFKEYFIIFVIVEGFLFSFISYFITKHKKKNQSLGVKS